MTDASTPRIEHSATPLTTLPLQDPPTHTMPHRSTLCALVPAGLGTPLIESLTSYTARLASAHSVTTTDLLALAFDAVPKDDLHHFGWRPLTSRMASEVITRRPSALNGAGREAYYAVSGLRRLTTLDRLCHLTMIPLRSLMPLGLELSERSAWCPACLQTWKDYGISLYEPLLWKLDLAAACPLHRRPLVHICSTCLQISKPLSPCRAIGYCDNCGAWLGEPAENGAGDTDLPIPQPWEAFVSSEIGHLLAFMSRGPVQLHLGTIRAGPAWAGDLLNNWDWGPCLRPLEGGVIEEAQDDTGQTLDTLLRACAILGLHLPNLLLGASLTSAMGDTMLQSYLVSLKVTELRP